MCTQQPVKMTPCAAQYDLDRMSLHSWAVFDLFGGIEMQYVQGHWLYCCVLHVTMISFVPKCEHLRPQIYTVEHLVRKQNLVA